MAIAKGSQLNFETLKKAFESGDVALVECQDKSTGKQIAVIAAINRGNGWLTNPEVEYTIVPFAKMFDGNPYEEINPPLPEGGFSND